MTETFLPGLSRRGALLALGAAALLAERARAQGQPGGGPGGPGGPPPGPPPTAEQIAKALPLKSSGVEHVSMTVPDAGAAARFYSKLFNPDGLHKEKDGDLRYYVWLEPGYLAIGAKAMPPYWDHFCTLAADYNGGAMAARLAKDGLPPARGGIIPDPNGIGLQLLPEPGGLARTTVPATRIVNGDAVLRPHGLRHVVLLVDDVDTTLAFYAHFFPEGVTRGEGGEARIAVAKTEIILRQRPPTEPPRLDEIGINVEAYDRPAVIAALERLGASVTPSDATMPSALQFRDPYGLGISLRTL